MPVASAWHYVVFPSELGWMALGGTADRVHQLSFGHDSAVAARRALTRLPRGAYRDDLWFEELVERLQAYAKGARDDFRDVPVDLADLSEFAVRVVQQCRRIPPGATVSYGRLAEVVGRSGAARAVGGVMRTNRIPIIIPCHRVVGSGGKMHGYSGADGITTKRRLLDMEIAAWLWSEAAALGTPG